MTNIYAVYFGAKLGEILRDEDYRKSKQDFSYYYRRIILEKNKDAFIKMWSQEEYDELHKILSISKKERIRSNFNMNRLKEKELAIRAVNAKTRADKLKFNSPEYLAKQKEINKLLYEKHELEEYIKNHPKNDKIITNMKKGIAEIDGKLADLESVRKQTKSAPICSVSRVKAPTGPDGFCDYCHKELAFDGSSVTTPNGKSYHIECDKKRGTLKNISAKAR